MLSCDANPAVAYLQEGLSLFRGRSHCDMTTTTIVFDGVVEQREYGLFEQCRSVNQQNRIVWFFLNTNLRLVRQRLYSSFPQKGHIGKVHYLMLPVGENIFQAGKQQAL